MFRKMRRFKQQVSDEACKTVLREERRAAFSVIGDDGYPYTIPVDFLYVEEENRIYFHGAKEGHKVDAIRKNDKVCFTVWDTGFKKEGHWEWNVTSVVVFGRAKLIDDRPLAEKQVLELALKYYPTRQEAEEELASAIDRVQLYAIDIEQMTGKLVNEK